MIRLYSRQPALHVSYDYQRILRGSGVLTSLQFEETKNEIAEHSTGIEVAILAREIGRHLKAVEL